MAYARPRRRMITPTGIRDEICTPGGEQRHTSGHTVAHSTPQAATSMTAGIRYEICTPVRRRTARASGHTVAYSTPPSAR
ncbi:MAG: hypothetical protein ACLTDS_01470 [Bianqueaceae bacterium]